MGSRNRHLTALFCGSQDWVDENIIFACMWGLYEIIDNREEKLRVIYTNDKGVGRIVEKCARKLVSLNQSVLRAGELELSEYPIDPESFTPVLGYIRNEKMLSENNPDFIFAFVPDIRSSPGTEHMLELARSSGIPAYLVQRYS
jgi:hypothetical protein